MSVQDERELRERLGGLLGKVEPRPAPVLRAMHQGRGIRMRRWVSAAAGIAVLAGCAVALPIALHGQGTPSPAGPLHYSVTVNPPGRHAPTGLISSGTQDGHRWTVVLSDRGQNLMVSGQGISNFSGPIGGAANPVITEQGGGGGKGGNMAIIGLVRADVTRVAITLSGGKVLNLIPVRYDGHRYIGLAYPWGVPMVGAVAYAGGRELAYSPPRHGMWLDNWWQPGQVGPARVSGVVSSGVTDGHTWRYSADIGPWGYCYNSDDGSSACLPGLHPHALHPASGTVQEMACDLLAATGTSPWTGLASAGSAVRTVVLTLSDGSSEHISPAKVGGARLFGYGVGKGLKIVAAKEFSASGQVVGTTPARALNCP